MQTTDARRSLRAGDRDARRSVFVMGLDDFHRQELRTLRDADRFDFHALFEADEILHQEDYQVRRLLAESEAALDAFERDDGQVDGIIGHWDFPVTSLVPLLCKRRGLPGPSLESVCRCTNKYWSRMEQQRCVPECTPRFQAVGPFAEDVASHIELPYPFWIKPIKAYASGLGFRIDGPDDLAHAIEVIRAEVGTIGEPYADLLELMDAPEDIRALGGTSCLVEEIVGGREVAPEGYVHRGEVHINGLIDMPREHGSFQRYEYPAEVEPELARRIEDATRRIIEHFGYDNACFNVEFFFDEERDRLSVIEVNPRISQSHSYLFERVDGTSNHELAVKVAIDEEPHFVHGDGRAATAAKCMVRVREDGVVCRVPDADELRTIHDEFPDCLIDLAIEPGGRLNDLPEQDAFSYCIAVIDACGRDREDMLARYRAIRDRLDIHIDPISDQD